MPRVARLWSDLELESSQFTVGLRKAVTDAATATTKIQRSLSGVRSMLLATAASVASMGLMSAAREALDYASSLEETAQQLGVTTRDLQAYRYAATQAGVAQEVMDKSLAKLTRTMGEARNGGKAQAAAFRELNGILGKDILASAQTAGDALPLIAEGLSKLPDVTKRARLEAVLFGRAGQQLEPLLNQGAAGVNALRDAADSLGIVLSERQIQDADRTADKLSELNTVLSANIAGAISGNTREIYGLVDALTQLVGKIPETFSALNRMRYQAAENVSSVAELYALGSGSPRLARDAQRSKKLAGANLRQISAQERIDAAARRLEKAGYDVPSPDAAGNLNTGAIVRRDASVTPPSAGTPAPSQRGGGRGGDAADKAERTRLWYEAEIARAKVEELAAQDQIIGSYRTRYAFEMERIAQDRAGFARDLQQQEGLSAAQRAELVVANERVLDKRIQLADNDRTAAMAREGFELASQANDLAQEAVRLEIDRARTSADRRDAELRLLELQKRAEAAQIELVLATESTASTAWQNAKRRRETLDARYASHADTVRRDTLGPLAKYLDDIPRTAREVEEAYEGIAVRGLSVMNDELAEAAKNVLGLKGAFGDLIAELIVLEAKRSLFGLLANLFKVTVGGGGFDASWARNSGNAALEGLKLPGMAHGGSMMVGGNHGIDRNVLSINGVPRAKVSASERIDVSPLSAANDRGPAVVQIMVDEGAAFVPRVQQISGDVSVEMIRVAGPAIRDGAAQQALRDLRRPRI